MTNVSSQHNCILDHCRKGSLNMVRLLLLGAIISTNIFLYLNHTKFHISEQKSTLISLYPLNFYSIVWKHGSDLDTLFLLPTLTFRD